MLPIGGTLSRGARITTVLSLPAAPETAALYVAALAEHHRVSTILRRLSAISQQHLVRGFESPTRNETVRTVLKGVRRTLGVASDQKVPLFPAELREMVASLPDSVHSGFVGGGIQRLP
jgi:hypothetical protein